MQATYGATGSLQMANKDELSAQLIRRRNKAYGKKDIWRSLMMLAYQYALPQQNLYIVSSPGTNYNWNVYDSTLVVGLRQFTNRMINAFVPPGVNWMNLIPGEAIPEDNREELTVALQKITDKFFFYLRQSNFQTAISEAMTEMGISTGILQCNEGDLKRPLIFSAIPSPTVAVECGPHGNINAFFRDWLNMSQDSIYELWGDEFTMPENLRHDSKSEKFEIDLYECSYEDYKAGDYKTYVIEKSTGEICYEKVEKSWEWIGFRFSRRAGEDYGRGPVLDALPTAATINKAMEDELRAAALAANPPLMALTDSIINPYTMNITPNSIIRVKNTGMAGWPIQPIPFTSNVQFTAIILNDLRSQVNEIMMVQPLQPLQDGPVRTATEVAVVQQQLIENAGAQFSRLQKELLDPLVERILWILTKKGLIEPFEIDGRMVALSYETPLSMSKNQGDLQKFLQWFEIASGIFTPGAAVNLVDLPRLPRWIGEKLNVDLTLIKSTEETQMIINKAAEEAQNAAAEQQPGQPEPAAPTSSASGGF